MFRWLDGSSGAWSPGRGGASQPAESTADASQLQGLPTVRLNLGSFNCGIDQLMLAHCGQDQHRHRKNLGRIIAKGVLEQDLHMVTLCEVGGHKKGFDDRKTQAQNLPSKAQKLVSEVLKPHYKAISCQAYMATWQAEEEPGHRTSVTLTLVGEPEVVQLPGSVEPQLVIMVFIIAAAEHRDKHGLLISGILHTRTPSGEKIKIPQRKSILQAALQTLEQRAATASSGASQPTAPVVVLTGDVNLNKSESESAVQNDFGGPSVEKQWQVLSSNAALSGDVLFIKGAIGESFDVSVGRSYPADRGMRNDAHDFFGVALSIPMCDKEPRGQKRPQVSAGGGTHPAAKEQRQVPPAAPDEKRLARNNISYTKAAFLAFYSSREFAEQEWAAAPLGVRRGAINALTGRVVPRSERIVQEMYDWYNARVDDEELHVVFRHLQNTLFKTVTVHLSEDVWRHPDVWTAGGASQLAEQGEAHLVVSREHVAQQVHTVIARREKWLQDRGLKLDDRIRGDLADCFLDDAKSEFHGSDLQKEFQERDSKVGSKKVQSGKHSRWSRHTQKLGGTPQMWTLLSFTGRFDVAFLEDVIARGAAKGPPKMPGERTEQQKEEKRDAQVARGKLRRGAMLERLQERLKGKGKREARPLTPKQLRVLQEYRSGELRRQANKLTKIFGHGRLKKEDDSFVDIGGSTGGFVRTVLDDWEPPDLADFEEDPSDLVDPTGGTDED